MAGDTVIEDAIEDVFYSTTSKQTFLGKRRNNPKTAVRKYLCTLNEDGRCGSDDEPLNFKIDKMVEHKIVTTSLPDGFFKRV